MGRLIDSPSGGHSEVLETLHYEGAIASGVQLFRVGPMVSARWGGDDSERGDTQFAADILKVLCELATTGLVEGFADATGHTVDLTTKTEPITTRVRLTATGRVAARAPRPRPQRDPWGGH